jgi:hypothetical protein
MLGAHIHQKLTFMRILRVHSRSRRASRSLAIDHRTGELLRAGGRRRREVMGGTDRTGSGEALTSAQTGVGTTSAGVCSQASLWRATSLRGIHSLVRVLHRSI